jgi:hypothetical protein
MNVLHIRGHSKHTCSIFGPQRKGERQRQTVRQRYKTTEREIQRDRETEKERQKYRETDTEISNE